MAIFAEKHSLTTFCSDDDVGSVGTTCPAQVDSIATSDGSIPSSSIPHNDELEDETASIYSWKTDWVWDDRHIPGTFNVSPRDSVQSDDTPVGVPAVPVTLTPKKCRRGMRRAQRPPTVAGDFEMKPAQLEAKAARLLRQAKELEMQAEQLAVEARKCANSGVQSSRTTVMLRNIPNSITQAELFDRLVCSGFSDSIDLLYLPADFKSGSSLGYAFVNLVSVQATNRFFQVFQGFDDWGLASLSHKVCEVCWTPQQGLDAHVDHLRNSSTMHRSVPDEYKPILLRDGHRIPFPAPTKRIRKPRV